MQELMALILGFFCIVALIYIIYILGYSMLRGAPYAVVGDTRLKTVIELLGLKKSDHVADLGAGDGRIVIACARKGAHATGFEINPVLVLLARKNIKKSRLPKATILQKDYWRADLSKFNCITVYGTTHIMGRLEKKLKKELKPGTRVVSNHFTFPSIKPKKTKNDVHLYLF